MSTLPTVLPGVSPPTPASQASVIVRFLRLALLLASNLLVLVLVLQLSFSSPAQIAALSASSIQLLPGGLGSAVPDGAAAGTAIELPWKRADGEGGNWLRLRFQVPDAVPNDLVACFSYLAPGARLYLNGAELDQARGLVTPIANAWSVPSYFPLTGKLLRSGDNRLDIHLDGANGGLVDVGKVLVGSDATVRPLYKRRLRVQSMGVQIVCLLVMLMGAVNTMIWWRRRQDVIYGLAGLSSIFSVLRNLEFFVDQPTLPVPLYLFICKASGFWLAALLIHGCDIVLQRRRRWMTRAGYGLAAAATMVLTVSGVGRWMVVPDALLLLLEAVLAVVLMVRAWHSQLIAHGLLWCAVVITVGAGVHQFLLGLHWVRAPDLNLVPYGWILFSRAISWLLIDGFIQTHNERESINLALEQRVEAFGRELEAQYSRIAVLERRNAVTAERERIVRDMHDGLGFHLITALNQVTGRTLTQPELVVVFSNALTELQNALHATAPDQNDLLYALSELRTRVEAGLRDAGIAITWNVAPETTSSGLVPSDVQEAIRIVQEALANAIKHSQSATVHLRAQADPDGVTRIRVIDEGVGIAGSDAGAGEGMVSMRWRAARIGARLDIQSQPGRTEVVLTLPGPAAASAG